MLLRMRIRSVFVVLLGLLALAFVFRPSIARASAIDLTSPGASVIDAQGAIWSDGTGAFETSDVFEPFLREQADSVETAFNTDATPVPLDGKPGTWTHSLTFGSLSTVTVGDTTYYALHLDANELGGGTDAIIALDGLKIFSAADPAIPDYGTLSSTGNLLYEMDPAQIVLMNTAPHPGSGSVDMTVLIPTRFFSDVSSGAYFYMYASLGNAPGAHTSDGFEEWSALQSGVDHPPVVTAPLAINGEEGGILSFGVSASDPDGDPISSLFANLEGLPEGASFTADEGNATGTFLWHMHVGDAGSYDVAFTAIANDISRSATTHITVGPAGINIAGEFTWTPNPGDEGTYHITFSATDEGGTTSQTDTITVVPPSFAPSPSAPLAPRAPRLGLAPRAVQKGPIISGTTSVTGSPGTPLNASVTASTDFSGGSAAAAGTLRVTRISKAASAAQTTSLTLDDSELPPGNDATFVVDQQPVISGPTAVTVTPGATLTLSRGASDPDGEALDSFTADLSALPSGNPGTFAVTGPATDLTGTVTWTPRVADVGTYAVTFTAYNRLVGLGSTTITVSPVLDARVFVMEPVKINIGSTRPTNCVYIEPVSGSFDLTGVDLSTVTMISAGTGAVTEIPAISKTAVVDDRDHNRIPDLGACFTKANLRLLFGLLSGSKNFVPVTIRGQLTTGAIFEGTVVVNVIGNGPNSGSVSIAPNPLNPQAKLSLELGRAGWLRVTLYDMQGRLVRQLANETNVAAGLQVITIDGNDSKGLPLASGVYFYRVESAEGTHQGRLAIVR